MQKNVISPCFSIFNKIFIKSIIFGCDINCKTYGKARIYAVFEIDKECYFSYTNDKIKNKFS